MKEVLRWKHKEKPTKTQGESISAAQIAETIGPKPGARQLNHSGRRWAQPAGGTVYISGRSRTILASYKSDKGIYPYPRHWGAQAEREKKRCGNTLTVLITSKSKK